MMEPMRGLNGTEQPEGYGTDREHTSKCNPGTLAPPDEPPVRPDWREMLERPNHAEERKMVQDLRKSFMTPRERDEEGNPPWHQQIYAMADQPVTPQGTKDGTPEADLTQTPGGPAASSG